MKGLVLRTASIAEVKMMLDWAAGEGWNPGLDDASVFHATDPEGFFIAERDGTPVASISVVNHTDDFAFLGFYICRPECRGQGIGLGLWHHALAHAGPRTVGLDGVAAQEANYAWRAPIGWSGLIVSASWASGPSERCFPVPVDDSPMRCAA